MPYWVYGLKTGTGDPLGLKAEQAVPTEPLFIEADSEEAAIARAKELGMIVESVEFVQPHAAPPSPGAEGQPGQPTLSWVVWLFRGLALLCALLSLVAVLATVEVVQKATGAAATVAVMKELVLGVLAVAFTLGTAEGLRILLAIERNMRVRGHAPGPDRHKRKPR